MYFDLCILTERILPFSAPCSVDQDMTTAPKTSPKADRTSYLTIVAISDTHELHRELDVPYGDLLIHAGDHTMMSRSSAAVLDFNDWLRDLPHRWKICIPGNHEYYLEADPTRASVISDGTLLINEGIELAGLKIWGSPVSPLDGGAFAVSSSIERAKLWASIPDDVDILVTHVPPYGILDKSPGSIAHAGCPQLLQAVLQIRPKLHIFGHVHGAHGVVTHGDTLFVNAALLGVHGELNQKPVVFRLPRM